MAAQLGTLGFGLLVGVFGAYLGLGGGLLVVPFLALVAGLPAQTAVGTSLLTVITTSTAAAQEYLKSGRCDIRLGILLELFTTLGALTGGLATAFLPERGLYVSFGVLLVLVAVRMFFAREKMLVSAEWNPPARYPNYGGGAAVSFFAGLLSSALGVGGGILKIPAMNQIMKVPLPVAFATSNLMIGVTATAGALVYFARGEIDFVLGAPLVLGTAIGAFLGAKTVRKVSIHGLRLAFVGVLLFVAYEMLARGIRG